MKNIVNLTDKTLPQAASHPVKARTPLGENQLAITAEDEFLFDVRNRAAASGR